MRGRGRKRKEHIAGEEKGNQRTRRRGRGRTLGKLTDEEEAGNAAGEWGGRVGRGTDFRFMIFPGEIPAHRARN